MMFWRDDNDRVLARYLLGELSEGRRAGLEERLLGNEDLYERLLIAEDELIDAYVRDELAADQRLRFEARFLASPQRAARVELARDLKAAARAAAGGELTREHTPLAALAGIAAWLGPRNALSAAAATAVLIVAGLLWQQPWVPMESESEGTRLAGVTTMTLLPSVRGETVRLPRLELADTIGIVELSAWVEGKAGYRSFRAHLRTSRGEALWSSGEGSEIKSTEREPTVVLRLPAEVFRRAEEGSGARHVLTLEGFDLANRLELIDVYEFDVVR